MFERVVAPLTGIVGPGVPVQGGCTIVIEQGWTTGREDPVFLEVGDILRHGWVGQQVQITAFSSVQASMTSVKGMKGSPYTHRKWIRRTLLEW